MATKNVICEKCNIVFNSEGRAVAIMGGVCPNCKSELKVPTDAFKRQIELQNPLRKE